MRLYIRGRGKGKTTHLIKWAQQALPGEKRIIVTPTQAQAEQIMREHDVVAISAWNRNKLHGWQGDVVFGIDELEAVLRVLLQGDIAWVTLSPPLRMTG